LVMYAMFVDRGVKRTHDDNEAVDSGGVGCGAVEVDSRLLTLRKALS